MKPELLYDLLNRALTEEMGLVITTNNPHQLSIKLHEIKRASSRYAEIEITVPNVPAGHLVSAQPNPPPQSA